MYVCVQLCSTMAVHSVVLSSYKTEFRRERKLLFHVSELLAVFVLATPIV